ncbi:WXG100-like domain-containing protein, partial [Streptomyces sp. IBSBF 2435]|uniref:WXG100-like domain-containing protein n=1 Tax=Streptomyces sp. IBSBF 2435 TaxID=2903531 RepID=UPI003FA6C10E
MSVNLPPELGWVARLAVGQSWPKGDEDRMRSLGMAWDDAARALAAISREITPATRGVLNSVGGSVADEFGSFVRQLQSNVPDMAEASSQLGKLGRNTGVQLEYAKYMILVQLVWLAFEIAQLAFWAPEAIPALITSVRLVVRMLLRRLFTAIATGIGMMVAMDAVIQGIQMLKGDRTSWSVENTVAAIESGAIGGAIGGAAFGLGGAFVPKFSGSLIGKAILGAGSGAASTVAMNELFHSGEPEDVGFGAAAGAIGALGGGGKRRAGGGGETRVDTFDFHLPSVPDLPDLHGPAKPPGSGFESGGTGGASGRGGPAASGPDAGSGPGAGSHGGAATDGSGGPPVRTTGGPVNTTGGDTRAPGGTPFVRPPVESEDGHVPVAEAGSHPSAATGPETVSPRPVRTTGSATAGGHGSDVPDHRAGGPAPVSGVRAAGTGGSGGTFTPRGAPPTTTAYHPAAGGEGRTAEPAVRQSAAPNSELPGFTTAFPARTDQAPAGPVASGPPVTHTSGAGDGPVRGEQGAAPSALGGSGGVVAPVHVESAALSPGAGSATPVRSDTGQDGAPHGGPAEVAPRAPRPPASVGGEGGGLGAGHSAGAGTTGTQGAGHVPPAHQPPTVVAEPSEAGGSHLVLPDTPSRTPGGSLRSGGPAVGGGGHVFPEVPAHTPGSVAGTAPGPSAVHVPGGGLAVGDGGGHVFPEVPAHTPGSVA